MEAILSKTKGLHLQIGSKTLDRMKPFKGNFHLIKVDNK